MAWWKNSLKREDQSGLRGQGIWFDLGKMLTKTSTVDQSQLKVNNVYFCIELGFVYLVIKLGMFVMIFYL